MSFKGHAKYIYIAHDWNKVSKIDFWCNLVWEVQLPGVSNIRRINVDQQDNIYVSDVNSIQKYDSNLNHVWTHEYPEEWEGGNVTNRVTLGGDWQGNTYYSFRYVTNPEDPSWMHEYSRVFRKLGPSGNILWAVDPLWVVDISFDKDGELYLLTSDLDTQDRFVRKYTEEGSEIWSYNVTDLSGSRPHRLAAYSNAIQYLARIDRLFRVTDRTSLTWDVVPPQSWRDWWTIRGLATDPEANVIYSASYKIGLYGEFSDVSKWDSSGNQLWYQQRSTGHPISRPYLDFEDIIHFTGSQVTYKTSDEGEYIRATDHPHNAQDIALSYEQTPAQVYRRIIGGWKNLHPCNVYVNQGGVAVPANVHINE